MMIVCYARKSNNKPNDSVANQLSIMRSYIQTHNDLRDADVIELFDDGASGIDVNRDALQELLSIVRQRKVDVIIVKDLSRLGRNYLDVYKLTESIFPFMGVRLVAVSDNYDSDCVHQSAMDLSTAFKSVLNEYYVIESSEKVRNSCAERIRNGSYLGKMPYGYLLSDEKKPVINEKQASIVREMYQLYSGGSSLHRIMKVINSKGVLSYYGKQWRASTIRRILTNPTYIGVKVSLTKTRDIKTKEVTLKDSSQWFVRENAYPPIIDQELFDSVQQIMATKGDKSNLFRSDKHLMARKLYCNNCQRPLHRDNGRLRCNNGNVTGSAPCFKGALKQKVLYAAVLEQVKHYIGKEFSDYTSGFSFSDISIIKANIIELKEKKAKVFDELYTGSITEQEFVGQNEMVSQQIIKKQKALERCRKSVTLHTRYASECPIETLRRLYDTDELSKEHMQFVKHINVFDAEHFEVLLQDSSPLDVLCRNMSIYEEDYV